MSKEGQFNSKGKWKPRRKIAEKDGVSVRTQMRREKMPGYPKVIEINGRVYIDEDEHDAWRASQREVA
jgi:hypothetical protein